jgi:hypothetical protein
VYVHSLDIRNFRCFEEAHLELNYPGRAPEAGRATPRLENVNLLVGGNGAGKSSVFQALVVGVLGRTLSSSGFQAEYLVRRASSEDTPAEPPPSVPAAVIDTQLKLELQEQPHGPGWELWLGTGSALWLSIGVFRIGDLEDIAPTLASQPMPPALSSESAHYFLAGYGASRRTERPEGYSESSRRPRYQRVAGLFEDHVGLVPFTFAYLQLRELRRFTEARTLLNALLPDGIDLTDQTDAQGRPLFDRGGVLLPFSALSDGFRAFTGWVWDLLFQMARLQPRKGDSKPLTEMPGVVIVDEIDLFLHPEWQRCVVEQIATAFPRLQFLFSSHSPLVAGALEPANLFVLDDQRVEQYRENVYGLTANQVLTSSYFGLHSTRAPGTGTLETMAHRSIANGPQPAPTEQADPSDLALDPRERARRMLEEIGDE